MSSSPQTPMQRAQRFIRPKLKPKSPLRQGICLPNTPISPIDTRSSISSSSSTSEHGHAGSHKSSSRNALMHSYSTSNGTLSTSNSGNSLHASSSKAADVPHVQVGDYTISLPLLVTVGAGLFAGGLVLRAIVTFSASLLRLFVLGVVIVAALTFSQLSEKQKKANDTKDAVAEARTEAAAAAARSPLPTTTTTTTTTAIRTTYVSGSDVFAPAVIDVSAYRANSGGDKATSTQLTSPHASHNYGYGHVKHSRTPSKTQSSTSVAAPSYSTDGRTRQLLASHQCL